MTDRYVVLAKRPSEHGPDGFDYQPAGSVWPTREPVENHQAYCQAEAEADRTCTQVAQDWARNVLKENQ